MNEIKKGGKRSGSGRKPKFTEDNETVSIRVPKSKKTYYRDKFTDFVKLTEGIWIVPILLHKFYRNSLQFQILCLHLTYAKEST